MSPTNKIVCGIYGNMSYLRWQDMKNERNCRRDIGEDNV